MIQRITCVFAILALTLLTSCNDRNTHSNPPGESNTTAHQTQANQHGGHQDDHAPHNHAPHGDHGGHSSRNTTADHGHSSHGGHKSSHPNHNPNQHNDHATHRHAQDSHGNSARANSQHNNHGGHHDGHGHSKTQSTGRVGDHNNHSHADHAHEEHKDKNHAHGEHAHKDHSHNSNDGHARDQKHGHDHSHDGPRILPVDKPKSAFVIPNTSEFDKLSATEIFQRRMLPIMISTKSSSCTECHFSGVELRDFIQADQAATFAGLRNGGLIDVDNPDQSKILRFIARQPETSDALVAKVREQEYVAFRAWIRAATKDPSLLKATAGDDNVGTKLPVEVIRHARKDRVLSSFVDNVWSQIGRCVNCHSPELNRKKIGRNGFTKEDVDAISWVVPRNPAATLAKLEVGGNIDLDDPEQSLMLTKPSGLEDHGGGPKFHPGGHTYKQYLAFLTDYAAIKNGEYKTARQLPEPSKEFVMLGKQHLRIVNIPERYRGMAIKVDLHRRDERNRRWSENRWATAFNPINPKNGIWQSMISVTAPAGSPKANEFRREPILPRGAYLATIYLDQEGKTKKDPTYELGEREKIGQVEITGQWRPGYKPPKIIDFPQSSTGTAN